VLKPVAQGYQKVVPPFFQARISNFFDNIEDIGIGLNNILQGKAPEGINDFGRVLCNTTIGVLGFWDVASENGVDKHNEDFGQTLAVWGVNAGPYFVIPLLGPSTLRDAPARAVDPSWYYSSRVDSTTYWSLWTLDKVRTRAGLLKAESVIEGAALDRYTFIRDAWVQRRNSQVYDGNPPRPKEEE
jgi:phospholipid-binding lipoprotein MlaA